MEPCLARPAPTLPECGGSSRSWTPGQARRSFRVSSSESTREPMEHIQRELPVVVPGGVHAHPEANGIDLRGEQPCLAENDEPALSERHGDSLSMAPCGLAD